MNIGDICNRIVVYAKPDTPVSELAALMQRYNVGNLIIAEGDEERPVPVGIVTDRDIVVSVVAEGEAPDGVKAVDIMSDELLVATEDSDLQETLQEMQDASVRRIPVVDAEGVLIGILAIDDLLLQLATELNAVANIVSKQRLADAQARA